MFHTRAGVVRVVALGTMERRTALDVHARHQQRHPNASPGPSGPFEQAFDDGEVRLVLVVVVAAAEVLAAKVCLCPV